MKELPPDEFFKIRELGKEVVKEMNGRLTADEAIMKYHRAATAGCLKIFVDSDTPKHLLVVSHFPGNVDSGFVCAVNLIYSTPSERTAEALNKMRAIYHKYAKENLCEHILGSSWEYKGSRAIDAIWLEDGFTKQETVYVKELL